MIGKESKQDDLAAWGIEHKPGMLDRIDEELDWRRFGKTLRNVFKDCKDGRPSYPPGMLFKVLLNLEPENSCRASPRYEPIFFFVK